MELKPEIMEVLGKLGVEQYQIDALTAYFTEKLVEYEKSDLVTIGDVAGLEKRLAEANAKLAKTQRLREGIARFVTDANLTRSGS